jgi:hypothetical protein
VKALVATFVCIADPGLVHTVKRQLHTTCRHMLVPAATCTAGGA